VRRGKRLGVMGVLMEMKRRKRERDVMRLEFVRDKQMACRWKEKVRSPLKPSLPQLIRFFLCEKGCIDMNKPVVSPSEERCAFSF
jgi:hypothetical protein